MPQSDLSKSMDEPVVIHIVSGVSVYDYKPFLTVMIDGKASGQLSPQQVREMALGWLEAAEAAESDSLVVRELMDGLGLKFEVAGQFLVALRERRSNG